MSSLNGLQQDGHASVTLCRYLVSQHPEVERKLAQELDEAGLLVSEQRPAPRKLSREDACSAQHLPYLKAVLKACACTRL